MKQFRKFILKAKKRHGDTFDYSKVEYHRMDKKICIICPVHGEFWQTPSAHLAGKSPCPKCPRPRQRFSGEELKRRESESLEEAKKRIDILRTKITDRDAKIKRVVRLRGNGLPFKDIGLIMDFSRQRAHQLYEMRGLNQ